MFCTYNRFQLDPLLPRVTSWRTEAPQRHARQGDNLEIHMALHSQLSLSTVRPSRVTFFALTFSQHVWLCQPFLGWIWASWVHLHSSQWHLPETGALRIEEIANGSVLGKQWRQIFFILSIISAAHMPLCHPSYQGPSPSEHLKFLSSSSLADKKKSSTRLVLERQNEFLSFLESTSIPFLLILSGPADLVNIIWQRKR